MKIFINIVTPNNTSELTRKYLPTIIKGLNTTCNRMHTDRENAAKGTFFVINNSTNSG